MSHSSLTRWIEDADARRFSEAARFDHGIADTHFLHLGNAIANLPSWFRQNVSRESLAAIGCNALAQFRRPQAAGTARPLPDRPRSAY
jgi:hypothetical protein